jgi:FKBP-type peptidyl-prolyl cis-trans isomerase 2
MTQVKAGDTVKVHYEAKLANGTVLDSTHRRDPIAFTIGAGEVIPGFEQAIVGMNAGELRTIHVSADKAFGPHHKELVQEVPPDLFPAELEPEVGQRLQIPRRDRQPLKVTVTEVSESSVALDANHPLAGQDLIFDIQLVEIE